MRGSVLPKTFNIVNKETFCYHIQNIGWISWFVRCYFPKKFKNRAVFDNLGRFVKFEVVFFPHVRLKLTWNLLKINEENVSFHALNFGCCAIFRHILSVKETWNSSFFWLFWRHWSYRSFVSSQRAPNYLKKSQIFRKDFFLPNKSFWLRSSETPIVFLQKRFENSISFRNFWIIVIWCVLISSRWLLEA